MMKFGIAALALAFSAPALTPAPAAQEAQTIEGIVAIVNDEPISYSDVRERAALLLLTLGVQSPNQQQVQQITAQALDELIDEKLQLQEANEYEVEVSDQDIASAVSDMARQSGMDRDGLINVLLAAGVNPSSLQEQMRSEIAWRRIMGGLYGKSVRTLGAHARLLEVVRVPRAAYLAERDGLGRVRPLRAATAAHVLQTRSAPPAARRARAQDGGDPAAAQQGV